MRVFSHASSDLYFNGSPAYWCSAVLARQFSLYLLTLSSCRGDIDAPLTQCVGFRSTSSAGWWTPLRHGRNFPSSP